MTYNKLLIGKRLLILGGAAQCLKVVEAAKALGVYTIVTDINESGAAKLAADEALPYSVMDYEGLYRWCLAHPVDGILNYCVDPAQKTHQILCERFGYPSYGTKEQYHILTDKSAFKKLCIESGVDIIPEYDENELASVEFPVLVKPSESSGSRGQAVCYSRDELCEAVRVARDESRNKKVIVEKYMGGKQDFTVTFLVIDGHPFLIRVGDRQLGKASDGLDKQCICTTSPSKYTELYLKKVHNRIVDMIKNVGIQNGPVFFQGFIDGEKIRLYDPGIRFPGGEYDRLYNAVTGIDTVQAMIKYALTGKISLNSENLTESHRLRNQVAVQLTIAARAGVICEYSGFEKIQDIPGVVYIAKKAQIGSVIPESGDVKQRVLEVAYLAENLLSAKSIANTVYDQLKILDEMGQDMIVSKGFSIE